MPAVNVDAMNEHLAEISRCVSLGAIAVLVLDGAGWHSSPRLEAPDNVALPPLPSYSPELVWGFLCQAFSMGAPSVFARPGLTFL